MINVTQGVTIILNVTSGEISITLARCNGPILESANATCNRTKSLCQIYYNSIDLLNLPACPEQRDDLSLLYGQVTGYDQLNTAQLMVLPRDQRIEQQPPPNAVKSTGLSAGEIVGIVIASVFLVVLMIGIGFAIFAYKRRRSTNTYKLSDATETSASTIIRYRQHWQ